MGFKNNVYLLIMVFIENGYLLSSKDAKRAIGKYCKESASERIAPFAHATHPSNQLVRID